MAEEIYPCCQHCRDFGRLKNWFDPTSADTDHENHTAMCYTTGCAGGVAISVEEPCDHVGTGRRRKFDHGNCPLLCEKCYYIVGYWDKDGDHE